MAIYWLTPGFKGRTFKLCVHTRWDFNFCVRSTPLRGTDRQTDRKRQRETDRQRDRERERWTGETEDRKGSQRWPSSDSVKGSPWRLYLTTTAPNPCSESQGAVNCQLSLSNWRGGGGGRHFFFFCSYAAFFHLSVKNSNIVIWREAAFMNNVAVIFLLDAIIDEVE